MIRYLLAATIAIAPATVHAQEGGSGIAFDLGVGSAFEPDYFGDDNRSFGGDVNFRLDRLQLGGFEIGGEKTLGFGFDPSFRGIGSRTAEDFPELEGLNDIDFSLEMGGGFAFRAPTYDLYAVVRYGVIGHEAWVAEIGGDLIVEPIPDLTIKLGPRMEFGDDQFVDKYFGVTAAEDAASAFDAYDPDPGIISAGAELEAWYQVTPDWSVVGKVAMAQLQGDVADSPIVEEETQLSAGVYLSRKVSFGF